MTAAETYRAHAAAQRVAAASTNLPHRRAMHERCAQTWEEMAQSVDDTLERTAVNLAAKAARG
jgi:hypothetical protein